LECFQKNEKPVIWDVSKKREMNGLQRLKFENISNYRFLPFFGMFAKNGKTRFSECLQKTEKPVFQNVCKKRKNPFFGMFPKKRKKTVII
jgi:sorbitol-specific phosphotransferase system component IIC